MSGSWIESTRNYREPPGTPTLSLTIEAHPSPEQPSLLEWCKQQGIVAAAYGPSGNNIYGLPKALDDAVVVDIARELGRTPGQVLIQGAVQRSTVVLPKSVTPARIADNFKDLGAAPDCLSAYERARLESSVQLPELFGRRHLWRAWTAGRCASSGATGSQRRRKG